NISEINKVEFYIDDKLMETVYDMPFSWKWEDASPFTHTIKVIAYDSAGNSASDEREVWTIM
ncbi:MAG: T9SS C-terminal target domain-containing protein, partial [Thermoplasmata archaeon]